MHVGDRIEAKSQRTSESTTSNPPHFLSLLLVSLHYFSFLFSLLFSVCYLFIVFISARRVVSIGDTSGASVDLTLWHARAVEWNTPVGSIVAIRGVRVQEYNGLFLSLDPLSHSFFCFLFFVFLDIIYIFYFYFPHLIFLKRKINLDDC